MPSRTVPYFSVLLPTYNRAEWLPLAIQSVLNQTFGDFEIVISNGGSSDNTDSVIKDFDDPRIQYFHSTTRLSMAENYEFSLSKANGRYIIFFSDDDAFVPSMLQRIWQVVERKHVDLLVFPFAYYSHDSDEVLGLHRNTLSMTSFSGELFKVDSRADLKRMYSRFAISHFDDALQRTTPLIGNIVLKSSLVDLLRTKVEKLFGAIPVDTYFISLVLNSIDNYLILDLPLLAWSKWTNNSSIDKSADLRRRYEELLNGGSLDYVPLKFALPLNCIANSILKAHFDLNRRSQELLDFEYYFVEMAKYLLYLEAEGVNTDSETEELRREVSRQTELIQRRVEHTYRRSWFSMRQKIKILFPKVSTLLRGLLFKIRGRLPSGNAFPIHIHGDLKGFSNVLDGAATLDRLISGKFPIVE